MAPASAHVFRDGMDGSWHQRISPFIPRRNGKVERNHRIFIEKFLYASSTWHSKAERAAVP